MQEQLSIRLPSTLAERLSVVSERLQRSRAQLVRMALERFFEEMEPPSAGRPIDRVRDLVGSVATGVDDLGEAHRKHLLSRFRGSA
jgi:predicted DNA-binding protein